MFWTGFQLTARLMKSDSGGASATSPGIAGCCSPRRRRLALSRRLRRQPRVDPIPGDPATSPVSVARARAGSNPAGGTEAQ
jgi:hypothetical protein